LEPVKDGAAVWKYVEGFDCEIRDWSNLPQVALDFLDKYAVFQHGYCTMNNDDGRFYNHSDDPNTAWNEERNAEVAIKDIEAGEEITCDYGEWGDDLSFLTAKLQAEK
jgi:SET domain-containing protein